LKTSCVINSTHVKANINFVYFNKYATSYMHFIVGNTKLIFNVQLDKPSLEVTPTSLANRTLSSRGWTFQQLVKFLFSSYDLEL